jgi:hypothetical protein
MRGRGVHATGLDGPKQGASLRAMMRLTCNRHRRRKVKILLFWLTIRRQYA